MSHYFSLLCVLLLTACGGGDTGETVKVPDPVVQTSPPQTQSQAPVVTPPLFNEQPLVIDDVQTYYSSVCDSTTSLTPTISFAIPVELNDDLYTDFFVVYWCSLDYNLFGTTQTHPTPDMVAAQVSDGAGGWYIDNERVFGSSWPKLGGSSRKFARGDFNGDGIDDFAFAMNWEDGRGADSDYNAKPAIILSQGDYQYQIVTGGTPCFGHAVQARRNNLGYDDAVFAGYCDKQLQAFRYDFNADQWIETTDSYPIGPNQPASHWPTDFQTIGTDAIVGTTCVHVSNDSPQECGIGYFVESADGWEMTDSYLIKTVFRVMLRNWNNDYGEADIVEINGKYYMGMAASQMCVMNSRTGSNDTSVVAMFDGWVVEDGEFQKGNEYDTDDLINYRMMLVFDVENNQLIQVESPFVDEPHEYNANFFDCKDINADGYADLVVSQFSRANIELGGRPLVFLNDRGTLVNYETTTGVVLPGHSKMDTSAQGFMYDVDSNGYEDVIVLGETTSQSGEIEIYTANRDLSLSDTPEDI